MLDTILDIAKAILLLGGGFVMFVFFAAVIACAFDGFFPDPPREPVLPIGERQDDGTMVLRLACNSTDYRDIQRAFACRQLRRDWPPEADGSEGTSDMPGLIMAEICREWDRLNANAIN